MSAGLSHLLRLLSSVWLSTRYTIDLMSPDVARALSRHLTFHIRHESADETWFSYRSPASPEATFAQLAPAFACPANLCTTDIPVCRGLGFDGQECPSYFRFDTAIAG